MKHNRLEKGSPAERKVLIWATIVMIALVICDQATKSLVVANIDFAHRITVIPGFFDLTHVTNKGAAWGMFHSLPWLPFTISVVAFLLILVFLRKLTDFWAERYFAMAMICSGILGNCSDRVFRGEQAFQGAVIDFLRFHWHNTAEWPSFNIADSAICCGVALFVLSTLIRPEPKKTAVNSEKDEAAHESPDTASAF